MFNACTTDQLLIALARTTRAAAGATGALDDYDRGQLFSATSIARNLAAEVRAEREVLALGVDRVGSALGGAPLTPLVEQAQTELAGVRDGVSFGAVLSDLLETLRGPGAGDPQLRQELQAALRGVVDAEVDALAKGTEA